MRLPLRSLACILLGSLTVAALAAPLPPPDQPGVTDLAIFREECTSTAATILLLEQTGQSAKATQFRATLWERYDAEVFARRAEAADLSLAVVNPWLPDAERAAATEKLARAAAELAELSTFAMPDPATRDQFLAAAGHPVTERAKTRAQLYLTLQKIRNGLTLAQLTNRPLAERRREVVARLERLAAAKEPLDAAIIDARDLPLAAENVRALGNTFHEPAAVDTFAQLTFDSLALDATLTRLIASDPANLGFWLARARSRFALGWRSAAVVDLVIASNFKADDPGVIALRDRIQAAPGLVASIWQEAVDLDDVQAHLAARRAHAAKEAPAELAPALERAARAAFRNRARRLYAASFAGKPEARQKSIAYIIEQNPVPPGLFPYLAPALGQQFETELAATGNDGAARFAVLQRHAALLGVTEGFWYQHLVTLLRLNRKSSAYSATDIARAMFPDAAWVKEVRDKTDPLQVLPEAEKK